ncbi:MAG: hypothetical protein LBQ66_01100 [Planctomycetaceae bacterium]|jgi:hypothetical protein|nr:hypothetical protein [Planctomycetaceae bacterium]
MVIALEKGIFKCKKYIDEKYERPDSSGLSCEVTSGGHYDFTVELKQKPIDNFF